MGSEWNAKEKKLTSRTECLRDLRICQLGCVVILLIFPEISRPTHDNTLSSCIQIAMRAFHPFLNLLILNLNNIEYNLKPENIHKEQGIRALEVCHFPFSLFEYFSKLILEIFFVPLSPSLLPSNICLFMFGLGFLFFSIYVFIRSKSTQSHEILWR